MIQTFLTEAAHVFLLVFVFGLLLIVRKGLWLVRLRPAYRGWRNRLMPLIEVVAGAVYIYWAVSLIMPDMGQAPWIAASLIALTLAGAGWFAIRDFVSGVVLRFEQVYATGQWIQSDNIDGFISKIGYRTLTIETDTGLQVSVPYSLILRKSLITTDQLQMAKAHTFRVMRPDGESVATSIARIRAAALTAFWSSPRKEPYVHFLEEKEGRRHFEVTVFSINEAYAPDVEQSVRRHMNRIALHNEPANT